MRNVVRFLLIVGSVAIASAALAQNGKPAQIIINNAPPSINIDVFIDAGKVQTAQVNQQGTTGFTLDFLSLGKPSGQMYVEVCKDGQRIRVISDGVNIPEDEGCNRKPIGAAFTFTCTNKITLNWAQAKGSFGGCGSFLTNKAFLIPVGAVIGTTPFLFGGDNSPDTFAARNVSNDIVTAQLPGPTPQQPQTPQTPQTPQEPPALPSPAGNWRADRCTVGADPRAHESVVHLCNVSNYTVSASNGGLGVTAASPFPPRIGGSYNATTGAFGEFTSDSIVGSNVPAIWAVRGVFTATTMTLTVTMTVTVNGSTDSVTYTITLVRS